MRTTKDGYRYADGTDISSDRTINEIRQELMRFGATGFLQFENERFCVIGFEIVGIGAFMLHLPQPDDKKFSKKKSAAVHGNLWERERARLYRVALNLVKAKLIAVQEGITTAEKEFFADLVVWNASGRQQTVYEWYAPQIEHLRSEGLQPPVLPAIEEPRLLNGRIPRMITAKESK